MVGGSDDGRMCPHAATCALFPAFSQNGFLRVWQINYCEANFERCARYESALRGERVPMTLLPNGKSLSKAPAARP